MKRVGIIESVVDEDKKVNFIGYGEYFEEEIDFEGIPVTTPRARMENGTIIELENHYFSDAESMQIKLDEYINKHYDVINVP